MNFNNALAGVSVHDFEAAVKWYQTLIGRPPDIVPMETVAAWQFRDGGWLEVFRDEERAGKSTVILAVASLPLQLDELSRLGIPVEIVSPPNIGEVAMVADPDGNRVVFAGPLTGVLDD